MQRYYRIPIIDIKGIFEYALNPENDFVNSIIFFILLKANRAVRRFKRRIPDNGTVYLKRSALADERNNEIVLFCRKMEIVAERLCE